MGSKRENFKSIALCALEWFQWDFFEVATNIADVRASIFGEFEHVNNPRTCLLLRLGGSLYNNLFVFYTIIDIIIRCDTITQ